MNDHELGAILRTIPLLGEIRDAQPDGQRKGDLSVTIDKLNEYVVMFDPSTEGAPVEVDAS